LKGDGPSGLKVREEVLLLLLLLLLLLGLPLLPPLLPPPLLPPPLPPLPEGTLGAAVPDGEPLGATVRRCSNARPPPRAASTPAAASNKTVSVTVTACRKCSD
jgi:hypothetical protein